MISAFEAKHKLDTIGLTLTVKDFDSFVYMVTHDSVVGFDRAIVKRYGEWVLIWTEHNGYYTEHKDHIYKLRVGKMSTSTEIEEVT